MAKGLYLMSDGHVLVDYGQRRRVPIPSAQYKQAATSRRVTNFRLKFRARRQGVCPC
jgi:hypothetical protein